MRDTEKLQEELRCLMQEYEKAAQQRLLLRQEQQDVAEVVINAAQTNIGASQRKKITLLQIKK